METKLEQIAVKAVNQLPKSVVREIRTPRSVGAGGGRPRPATRWARRNPRPYRDHGALSDLSPLYAPKRTSADHSEFKGARPGPCRRRLLQSLGQPEPLLDTNNRRRMPHASGMLVLPESPGPIELRVDIVTRAELDYRYNSLFLFDGVFDPIERFAYSRVHTILAGLRT
jgi:hypothetical protein